MPDPLWEKYYGFTPWQYSANNPLSLIDFNGKDAVAKVGENEITIKAVYIVGAGYTSDDVAEMSKSVNGYLNSQNYKVTEGEYSEREVKFDLQFVETNSENFKTTSDYNDSGFPIGNDIMKGTESEYKELYGNIQERLAGHFRAGVTLGTNTIQMHKDRGNFRALIHEILHTLFFDNDGASSGIGASRGNDMPNQSDINKLINNSQLPKVLD